MLIFLILLGALFGYGIAGAQRRRQAQTLRYISDNRGRFGPFHDSDPKA